jgi:apolipoprotein N-acyltransferase
MIAGLYSPGISLSPHYTYFSIGYSVYNISLFKELLPAGGIYLASFVILLVNYFIYFVLFKKDRRPMQALLLISLVVLIVLASNILRNKIRTDGVTKEILVGNAKFASSNDMEKEMQKGDAAIEAINYYLFEDTASGTQVFILPENFDVYNEFAKWNERGKNIFLKDVLVVGSYSNNHEKMYYLDSQKKTAGIYEKQILMPIGEYSPWFMTLIKKVFYGDTLPWRNVESGKTPSVFSYNDFKFGSSICSENVSPYIFSSEVRGGANVILNLASHAPFSGSKLLDEQTLVGNTTRALETGRYVVTATNYGTSFVIDDIGNAIYLQKHNKEGEFEFSKQKIKLLTYKTPYVIFGDYIVYLCLIFLLYYYLFRSSSGK